MGYSSSEILKTAALAARIIIESGGEIYRVEQTADYLCKGLGAAESESYATLTGVILSVTDSDGNKDMVVQRIKKRANNLEKVAAVNQISREVCSADGADPKEIYKRLLAIQNTPSYPVWAQIIGGALVSGAYVGMVKFTVGNFISAMLIAAIVKAVTLLLAYVDINDFVINFMGGFTASFVGWALLNIGLTSSVTMVVIASLMMLLPGLTMINALRDIVVGDIVTGISRGFEALFIVGALASGAAISHILLFGGGIPV